jgi:rhamnosyltransferase
MNAAQPFVTQTPSHMESKLYRPPLCAVIVTYHPSLAIFEDLRKVLSEAGGLVVVDNGSNANEVDTLRTRSRDLGFHLIENGQNLGIAEALNQGVRWAKDKGYAWIILLDQDSKIVEPFVQAMFSTWLSHPKRHLVASIHPRYMDPKTSSFGMYAPRAPDGSPIWSMSSGALMPTWIFDKIGWFASEFFIDWVDIEYCFRIRAAGYLIAESQAILLHDPGHAVWSSFLGFRFRPSHHNAVRRYYMSRNRVVVFRKYFSALPHWTLKAMYAGFRDTAKCFLGEKERPRKFRNFLLGTWDGMIGRMGTRQGL